MLHRALIKTHHMTSRKKISAINKLAKKWECAVYLKTGVPPGIMIAESEGEEGVREWVASVKRLRYKDYQLLRSEAVEQGRLLVEPGDVKEFTSMKGLASEVTECDILDWWRLHMGFTKGED
ncbi:hypothetical protein N7G274_001933 [Stereocaulon virgatum]|uniref:Uncharacterized protein n=1 Tax=Stereocaulon virgatum TaxID=373712 RepID=A0ABR4AJ76_9LECA